MKQNHLNQWVKRHFEAALKRQVEEAVGGKHHRRTSLDQHRTKNMARVLTTP